MGSSKITELDDKHHTKVSKHKKHEVGNGKPQSRGVLGSVADVLDPFGLVHAKPAPEYKLVLNKTQMSASSA